MSSKTHLEEFRQGPGRQCRGQCYSCSGADHDERVPEHVTALMTS